jgi:hypothetical protein
VEPVILVAIPSKGRAGKVRSQAIIPSASVFVPKLEAPAYRKAGAKNVVEVPDTIRGITATRNWILKNAKTRRVVMIDDDVRAQGFTRLYERHAVHEGLPEATWLGEFVKLFELTKQLGFRIWGTRTDSATRAAYPYFPFRFRSYVTASCCGIINDGRVAFDETYPVKEDYELCARCITEDGGVLSAQYLFWQNTHYHDPGGCHDYRTEAMERDCIKRLCRTYPGLVRAVERATSNWSIEIG